jgi:hypothetical protein
MAAQKEPGDFSDEKFESGISKYLEESNSPAVQRMNILLEKGDQFNSKIADIQRTLSSYHPGSFKGNKVIQDLQLQLATFINERDSLIDEAEQLYKQILREFQASTNFVPGEKRGGIRHKFQKAPRRTF